MVLGLESVSLSAAHIVAIHANPAKKAVAKQFGATGFVNLLVLASPPEAYVKDLLGEPADYAFECVGVVSLIAHALALVNQISRVCAAPLSAMSTRYPTRPRSSTGIATANCDLTNWLRIVSRCSRSTKDLK